MTKGFRGWLRDVWVTVVTVLKAMWTTLYMWFWTYKRRAFTETFEFPEVPVPVRPRFRGFHRYDLTTCIACGRCASACPVECISIDKVKSPTGKGFQVNAFQIDYTKCIFCGLCVEACPVACLFMGANYDLSSYTREDCVVDFAKLPLEIAWGRDTLNPTAVIEAKKAIKEPVWVKGEPVPYEYAAK